MELGFSKVDWQQEASTRERIYFGVVLLLVIVAAMRLLWIPKYEQIQKRKQEIKNVQLQVDTLRKFIDVEKKPPSKPKLERKTIAAGRLQRMLEEVPEDPQQMIAAVIQEITSRKKMKGLTLMGMSFDPAEAGSGYTTIPLKLILRGTFSGLQTYLAKVEREGQLFAVDNLKLRTLDDHPGLIEAELSASLYIMGTGVTVVPSKEDKKEREAQ